ECDIIYNGCDVILYSTGQLIYTVDSVFDVIQRECVAQLIPWFDDTYTVNVASDRVGEMADVTIVLSCTNKSLMSSRVDLMSCKVPIVSYSLCDHTDSDMDGVLSDILFLPYQHIVCDVKFIGYEFTNPVGVMLQIKWLYRVCDFINIANVTSYTMD
ncbi:unnamed protein product, partial [Rangifer tarandus platyrhynchus]